MSNVEVVFSGERINTQKNDVEPQPLYRQMGEPIPFPLDALGDFEPVARAIQRIYRAPDSICGQAILAGIAQIAQGYCDISIDGRLRPLSCFFVSVGETGERKSAVDEVATKPQSNREMALEALYAVEYPEWENKHLAWKQARDEGLKKCKTKTAKEDHLRTLGAEPRPPRRPVVLVEEPTYEGLIKTLAEGEPSIGLFSDEGGRFIGGHAMNAENALKTAAGLSGLWDKGCAKRTRSGDGHSSLRGKRVTMHLMLQGVVAAMLMGNDVLNKQGLTSRILMIQPDSTVGQRGYVEENIFESPVYRDYLRRCEAQLAKELPWKDDSNELDPPIIQLTDDAKQLWIKFHDYCDLNAGKGGEYEGIRGLANKAAEHAARLAGVLAVMHGRDSIDLQMIESGIKLMNFYLAEAARITDSGYLDDEIRDAKSLLTWIHEKDLTHVYPVLVYQYAPVMSLRKKTAAVKAISTLVAHGWLRPVESREIDGTRRKEVWEVVNV